MEKLSLFRRLAMQKLLQATVVIILVALAIGCSKKTELVGRWENTSVPELVEFKSDNSGIFQGKNSQPLMFKWQQTEEHSYTLAVDFQGQNKILKGVVQNDVLVLEGEGGKETYRKATSK